MIDIQLDHIISIWKRQFSNYKLSKIKIFIFFEGYSQCYLTVSLNRKLALNWGPTEYG